MSDPKVICVTPTRDRPEAFALCVKWLTAQRYSDRVVDEATGQRGPGRADWVVVDDGDVAVNFQGQLLAGLEARNPGAPSLDLTYIRRAPSTYRCTLHDNLEAFLDLLPKKWPGFDGWVAIWEDDEYYAPDYLPLMMQAAEAQGPGLVGIADAHYWHVETRRWHHGASHVHSSLCRTLIHARVIPHLVCAIAKSRREGSVFIDMELWASAKKAYPCTLLENAWHLSVGMKGLPGRGGLGSGHKPEAYRNADPEGKLLRQWIGPDADTYLAFQKEPAKHATGAAASPAQGRPGAPRAGRPRPPAPVRRVPRPGHPGR